MFMTDWRLNTFLCTCIVLLLAPTLLCAQEWENWHDAYRKGLEEVANSQWEQVLVAMEGAIALKPNPQQEVEMYALHYVDYLPFYWSGVASYNLGKWQQARSFFQTSQQKGAVRGSGVASGLTRYNTLIADYIELAANDSRLKAATPVEEISDNRLSNEQLQTLRVHIRDKKFVEAQRLIQSHQTLVGSELSATILDLLNNQLEEPVVVTSPPLVQNENFNRALNSFLLGDYEDALRRFNSVASLTPNFQGVGNWIRRTREELNRLGVDPDQVQVVRDTVQVSSEPLITFANTPEKVRSDSVRLICSVLDDLGVDRIEIRVSGSPLLDSAGEPVIIRPPDSLSMRGFGFALAVPLRMGDNEIVAIAHDIDSPPHQSAYPITIRRNLPIYKTPLFWGSLIFAALLALAGWLLNRKLKRRIAFVSRYNPYIAGAPIRNEEMFFGRDRLMARIINTLHNNSLMLHGPRRIGKTSLLHQLSEKLDKDADRDYYYVPVFIDLQGVEEQKFFLHLMQDIAEKCRPLLNQELELRFDNIEKEYTPRDFGVDIQKILAGLKPRTKRTLRLVLLIDEVDQLNSYSEKANQKLRSIFMKSYAEDLVAIMSGSYIRTHWESEGSPWYNFFEQIEVSGINEEQARELINKPVRGIFTYDAAAIERILHYGEGVPYRIQRLCVNAIGRLIEERRTNVTVEDIEIVKDVLFSGEEE